MKDAAMGYGHSEIDTNISTPELFDCVHLVPYCVGPEPDVWSLGCVLCYSI